MFYLILRMFYEDLMEGRISPSMYEALLLQASKEHEIVKIREIVDARRKFAELSSLHSAEKKIS